MDFSFFHGTPELLPEAGVIPFHKSSYSSLLNGRYTQRPENHPEARISGLEISGTLPTWGKHPLGKVLGSRLHSPGDRFLDFTM